MRVTVNGEERVLPVGTCVRDLLPADPGHAVAVNGEVVPRTEHERAVLEGDTIEIVTAVQGG